MGLQKIVVLCLAGVVIVGGGYFLLQGSGGGSNDAATNAPETNIRESSETEDNDMESEGGAFSSFMDIIARGQDYTCNFSYVDADVSSKGTAYIAGDGKVRVDMTTDSAGEVAEFHTINTGEKSYVWGADGQFAIVTDISNVEDRFEDYEVPPGQDDYGAATDIYNRGDVDYNCRSWRRDSSQFVPPADIEFFDFSNLNNIQNLQDLENFDFSNFPQPQ